MAFYEYALTESGQGYLFWFEYDPDLVAAIKQVPYPFRVWNSEEKVWWITKEWFPDACRYLDLAVERNTDRPGPHGRERKVKAEDPGKGRFNGDDRRDRSDRRDRPSSTGDALTEAFKTLHLQADAPEPVLDAVYRALTKLHHPDVGGTHERMRDINVAYEKAKKFLSRA